MKVNGVRIAIFAEGVNPNPTLYDHFYKKAKELDFLILANPAHWNGAARIAHGVLELTGEEPSVNSDPIYAQRVINRIKAFSETYNVDWISPFNEDGMWNDENTLLIYATLKEQLTDVQLVGLSTWGIESAIKKFTKLDIEQYISIATTHNLGFNHELWPDFIALAQEEKLPVWDSEATNSTPDGKISRLQAAIEAGVNGVVLYDAHRDISKNSGAISDGGEEMMALYLEENGTVIVEQGSDNRQTIDFPKWSAKQSGSSITLQIENLHQRKALISVYSVTGRAVNENIVLKDGINRFTFKKGKGIYILKINIEGVGQYNRPLVLY